jgi:hypothetical protein
VLESANSVVGNYDSDLGFPFLLLYDEMFLFVKGLPLCDSECFAYLFEGLRIFWVLLPIRGIQALEAAVDDSLEVNLVFFEKVLQWRLRFIAFLGYFTRVILFFGTPPSRLLAFPAAFPSPSRSATAVRCSCTARISPSNHRISRFSRPS